MLLHVKVLFSITRALHNSKALFFYLKYKTAALISQSRRWPYGRVKGLLNDGFFLPSSGRLMKYYFDTSLY